MGFLLKIWEEPTTLVEFLHQPGAQPSEGQGNPCRYFTGGQLITPETPIISRDFHGTLVSRGLRKGLD